MLSPQRVCCNQLGAMLVQHARAAEQARANTCPRKINVTSKSPVGDISVVTLIRTDTTLDHSQKAEKVCLRSRHFLFCGFVANKRNDLVKSNDVCCKTLHSSQISSKAWLGSTHCRHLVGVRSALASALQSPPSSVGRAQGP